MIATVVTLTKDSAFTFGNFTLVFIGAVIAFSSGLTMLGRRFRPEERGRNSANIAR